MSTTFCIDVFTPDKQPWMENYNPRVVRYPKGDYYTLKADSEGRKHIIDICHKKYLRFRCYEERWSRSDDYREQFFAKTKGPYRCRYCGKWLKKEYMVIDHIIPVAKTKKSEFSRKLLAIQGIYNVNDVKNLAPSCSKCNKRKSDKMGLWTIRGWLGKHQWFVSLYKAVKIISIICLIFIIVGALTYSSFIDFFINLL